ncbi:MAG: DUF3179 domain-containing protein, partial [Gammaproteobacteria bacterium]|nr:DUF3179 domain-containing protein [Gammaproteobacteria bacterium]
SRISSQIISYDDFRNAYPKGEVLSRDTGYRRPYGHNPYQGYDRVGQAPFLYRDPLDPRLPAMERVVSVSHQQLQRIYPFSELEGSPILHDKLGDLSLVLFSEKSMLSALDQSVIQDSRMIPSVTVYDPTVANQVLEFQLQGDKIIDKQTRSEWNRLGYAVDGPLSGERLTPVDSGIHFAFAWLAFNPDTQIYRAN